MPILFGDVKLLKSGKMADALEDGGGLAGLQIAQGVSDRIFGKQEGLRGVRPGEETTRQALRRSRHAVGAAKRAAGRRRG